MHPNKVEFREGFGMTESSPITHIQPGENAKLGRYNYLLYFSNFSYDLCPLNVCITNLGIKVLVKQLFQYGFETDYHPLD